MPRGISLFMLKKCQFLLTLLFHCATQVFRHTQCRVCLSENKHAINGECTMTISKEIKISRIVSHNTSCGQSVEAATKYAEDLLKKYDKDTASLIIRFRDDFGKEDIFLLENFSCAVEFYGWNKKESEQFVTDFVEKAYQQGRIDVDYYFGDVEYAKRLTRSKVQYVLLDSTDPFYNSIWGQIPADVAEKCCDKVKARIAIGM